MKFDDATPICELSLLIRMSKEYLYAKIEKLEAQIWRCIRQGLKVIPWLADKGTVSKTKIWRSSKCSKIQIKHVTGKYPI